MRPIALVFVCALLLGACGGGSSGEEAEPSEGVQSQRDASKEASASPSAAFQSCPDAAAQGGGDSVWVQGMECSDVSTDLLISMPDAFGRYKSLPESERQVSSNGGNGWVCWAALEGDYGPIHNVCRRDDATLIFYQS